MIHLPADNNPNLVKIHLNYAIANLRLLSGMLNHETAIMPVVKSDGYGHGLVEISKKLAGENGVWGFGISTLQEAYLLRRAGISSRLFLLSGCFPGDETDAARLETVTGVISMEMLDRLQKTAEHLGRKIPVHLKVDTGMVRYGLSPEELMEIVHARSKWRNILFQGIYTHMPVADERQNAFNTHQINRFSHLLNLVRKAGWDPEYVHMANSAALINFPQSHFNLVRPGIAIYGSVPWGTAGNNPGLQNVMSYSSRISSLRRVTGGTRIGYGHAVRVQKNSVVAVVPAGYDDGYMRSLSNSGKVLVKGVRCNILGRICMKAFMVDVTDVPYPEVGERVVMLGHSGNDAITVDELASWAGTISYELMCLAGRRNRRIFCE